MRKMMDLGAIVGIAFALSGLVAAVGVNTGRGQAPLPATVALTANNETCYSFTSESAGFLMHSRGNNDTRVCFSAGCTSTTYVTIPGGAVWTPDNMLFKNAESICFQNAAATDTIELLIWR